MEDAKNKKGIIVVLLFLAIILLPVGYSVYKELMLRKEQKDTSTGHTPAEQNVKK